MRPADARGLRIALYDNLANNTYIQAKAFRRRGVEVDLLLDPHDRFVMSDPSWEDLDLERPTASLAVSDLPHDGWPAWVHDDPPTREPGRAALARRTLRGVARQPRETLAAGRVAGPWGALLTTQRHWAIRAMRRYDCVIGYGFGAPLARLAGVPTVMQLWGGDINVLPFADEDPGASAELRAMARLQRWGLEGTARISYGDPGFLRSVTRLGLQDRATFIPTLVDTAKYTDGDEPELRAELLGGADGPLVLAPARQDFHWKGSDAMLRGVARAAQSHPGLRGVCAGWGEDLGRSRELAASLGVTEHVRFLPSALSKTRLLRYLRAADVVLDQFGVLGSYGTTALEAMSCSRPLLIWLDHQLFDGVFDAPPPVLSCKTDDEIAAALLEVLGDPGRRRALGAEARAWVEANHGDRLIDRTLELCHAAVAESR